MPAAKATQKRTKKPKCLTCANKAQSRGLCWTCLAAAKGQIRTKKKTEQQLIDMGLLLPCKKSGRPAMSGFAKRLRKAESGR